VGDSIEERSRYMNLHYMNKEAFFLAAYDYAELMLRDMRNAADAKKIQERIGKARFLFYDTFKSMTKKED